MVKATTGISPYCLISQKSFIILVSTARSPPSSALRYKKAARTKQLRIFLLYNILGSCVPNVCSNKNNFFEKDVEASCVIETTNTPTHIYICIVLRLRSAADSIYRSRGGTARAVVSLQKSR